MFILGLLGFCQASFSQASISGSTCVVTGTAYSYTLFSSAGNFTYSISGGVLTGTTNNSGSYSSGTNTSISVTWSTGISTGTISLSSSAGNATLTASITTALAGGSITGNLAQYINYNTIPDTIKCSAATGEACSPNYQYQWQQSPDESTWTNVSGATRNHFWYDGLFKSGNSRGVW